MPDKRTMQIESHDAAGYETDYIDFSEYDDGYGNHVAHGDLSVQRMVERGSRDFNWPAGHSHAETGPKPYDTEPFQSKSQWRKFFAMARRGEISKAKARQWAHETKREYSELPEKKG